jgi:hypothetical protein
MDSSEHIIEKHPTRVRGKVRPTESEVRHEIDEGVLNFI